MAAKSLQSCPILCDPIDGSPPGSPVPGILQAKTLEWASISFSNAWKWKVEVKLLGRVRLLGTPWTAAYQAPPSMGFSRPEYWSGVPLPKAKKPTWCVSSERVTTVGNWDSVSLGSLWKATEKTCLRHDSPRVKKSKIFILQLPSQWWGLASRNDNSGPFAIALWAGCASSLPLRGALLHRGWRMQAFEMAVRMHRDCLP